MANVAITMIYIVWIKQRKSIIALICRWLFEKIVVQTNLETIPRKSNKKNIYVSQ